MPAPRHPLFLRQQYLHFGRRARLAIDQLDRVDIPPRCEPFAEGLGLRDGGGQGRALHIRSDGLQARQRQGEQVTALARRKSVDLVDDNTLEVFEQFEAVGVRQQEGQAFRCRQQHMRRTATLTFLAIGRRVAAAGFDLDGESHLLDRRDEIALNIVGKCLQRRDVEGMQPLRRIPALQPRRRECSQSRQKPCKCLACACVGNKHGMPPVIARRQHFGLMPPHAPIAPGEPFGDFCRDCGDVHLLPALEARRRFRILRLHYPQAARRNIRFPLAETPQAPAPTDRAAAQLSLAPLG